MTNTSTSSDSNISKYRSSRIGVFTALEGAVVDGRTLHAGRNRAAIRRLLASGVEVIPFSGMTLEELVPVAAELGLERTIVIESGGGIARRIGQQWQVEGCSVEATTMLEVVTEIEDRSGASLLVYSALDETQAAQFSGWMGQRLAASMHREFSEPFLIQRGELDAVRDAASTLGFVVRSAGGLLHLSRTCDQGAAFHRLREELQLDVTIGVGSISLDADFVRHADIPLIIPGDDGRPDRELRAQVRHARVATGSAPYGWGPLVEEIVAAQRTLRSAPATRRRHEARAAARP